MQRAALDDRGDQHLARTVTGALIDSLQKFQIGMDAPQCLLIVGIRQVQQLAAGGNVACNTLCRYRQLEIGAAAQAGLDFGHNRRLLRVNGVHGQPLGVEQRADIGAGVQHDLVQVICLVNTRRDLLQLLVEQGLKRQATFVCRQFLERFKGRLRQAGLERGTHRSNS